MYYIIYPLVFLASLIPSWILYRLSDLMYLIMYYLWGYRKDVIQSQMLACFPDMGEDELKSNLKQYYRNMCDQIVETLKIGNMSEREFHRRYTVDLEKWLPIFYENDSQAFWVGHFFNFEWMNHAFQLEMKHHAKNDPDNPYVYAAVYSSLGSPTSDKIFKKLRSVKGSLLVSTKEFIGLLAKGQKINCMGLLMDQNPSNKKQAYWIDFFGIPTAFYNRPEDFARRLNQKIYFVKNKKTKQGHYEAQIELLAEDPSQYKEGELTKMYVQKLEENIREQLPLWMWSHKRWKHKYDEKFASRKID